MNNSFSPVWNRLCGCLTAALAPLLATSLGAAPAAGPAGASLLLSNATVHVVTGEPLAGGAVWVRDGKIQAVGRRVSAPGATVVDLQGGHLYPGLIALDSALGLAEIEAVRASLDTTEVGDFHPEVRAWQAVNPDSELLPVARANGITHAEAAPQGGVVAGLSGVVTFAGWTMEDMTIRREAGLHVYWPAVALELGGAGGGRGRGGPPGGGGAGGAKPMEEQTRERAARRKALDDFFQEAKAYEKARAAGRAALNPPWEAMRPVVRGEVPVMVHAEDPRQIKAAVGWAGTNGLRLVIVGGLEAGEVAGLLADKKVPVIFEGMFTVPTREELGYTVHFSAPEVLHRAGVKVAFAMGPGAMEASFARNLPYSASQAVAFGLPAGEALKGITLYPAEILGLGDRLGSIEAGKEASLFVADGDILQVRSRVTRLWIAGREADLTSRHTRLYDKYRARPLPNQ